MLLAATATNVVSMAQSRATITLAEALDRTLRDHPLAALVALDVERADAAVRRAEAPFEPTVETSVAQSRLYRPLTQVERAFLGQSASISGTAEWQAAATRRFRNGIEAGPVVSISRVRDSLLNPDGFTQSNVSLQMVVPLAQGRGRAVMTAGESAAALEREAAVLERRHALRERLFETATAYWTAVAAKRSHDVLADAATRGQTLVDAVTALAEADLLPRAEIDQARASLAERETARSAADQRIRAARRRLTRAIGGDASDLSAVAEPVDPPPALTVQPGGRGQTAGVHVAVALARREDLQALRLRAVAAKTRLLPALDQGRPRINLMVRAGYSGLRDRAGADDFAFAPFAGVRGLDISGGLALRRPITRSTALAAATEAQVDVRQSELRLDDRRREVATGTTLAVEALAGALERVVNVDRATALFQQARENEQEKLALGVGSLLDIITVEDRLTGSRLARVEAELDYALALADLWRTAAYVLDPGDDPAAIAPNAFVGMPEPPPAPPRR